MNAMHQNQLLIKLPIPMPLVIIGCVLIAVGLMTGINSWYVMIPILLAGIFCISVRDRLLFDFKEKTLYKYSLFIFLKRGEYIKLHQAEYISMIPVILSQNLYMRGPTHTLTDTAVVTNLIFPNHKIVKLYRMNYEASLKYNKVISNGLNVKIMISSSGNHEWIEPESQNEVSKKVVS